MIPGAHVRAGRTQFAVWAPDHDRVALAVDGSPRVPMERGELGWFSVEVDDLPAGTRYRYVVDGRGLPDPASRWQPDGVHGASAVFDSAGFAWSDSAWHGRPLTEYVISEVHIGTFSDAGTFDGAIEYLADLVDLGVTAVEVMPVAQFPGARNWGYDGVFPYAVQDTYGGPEAFMRFVDAAHGLGLCVVLDVVYNHLGPEGNVLPVFGPYFTDRYRTPWGDALNYDGADSDHVRGFFIENARQWVDEFHVDALRLDAVHAIDDASAHPFVEQLTDAVHAVGAATERHVYAIAESAANDARVITPVTENGMGCDAQWSDDFHHALHVLLTGERQEYYADFGRVADLATAFREGYAYSERYSQFRRRHHGRSAAGSPGERFVVFAQNHDHIGNRAMGDRLSALVDTDGLKVAAAAVLCSPFVPLLFMGEEYGETAPFPYFVSHTDRSLVRAVREGRRREFAESVGDADVPDPFDEATMRSALLDRSLRQKEPHASLLDWHRELLALRRTVPALASLDLAHTSTEIDEALRVLVVQRHDGNDRVAIVLTFGDGDGEVVVSCTLPDGGWEVLANSHDGSVPDHVDVTGTVVAFTRPARSALVLRLRT